MTLEQLRIFLAVAEMLHFTRAASAAIPELIVKKELQLGTLHSMRIIDPKKQSGNKLEIVQPVWKLKHHQRFHTRVMTAFEALLMQNNIQVA